MSSAIDKLDMGAPSSTRSLLLRMASAAVLVPMVVAGVHFGGRVFSAMIAFACIIMLFEWTRMVERRELSSSFYVLALGATAALFAAPSGGYAAAFLLCALSGLAAYVLAKNAGRLGFWPALAAPYIIAPSIALIWLRFDPENGKALTYLLFAIVWAADTGAFITGKLIGGPKISYALSPSKTWAGIGGGLVAGALAGGLGAAYWIGPASALAFVPIGGALGAASVVGDLVESAFKRNFGLKDISGFIPGHGGALDRLDGMIFATSAMTAVYFLYMMMGGVRG